MAKEKTKKDAEKDVAVLINESDLAKSNTPYEITAVVEQATDDRKGVAVATVDGAPVSIVADMPFFVDVEDFAFTPKAGDEINPSLNPSTLLDM